MARLEELTPGAHVRGLVPDALITVISQEWHGRNAIPLTYRDAAGSVNQRLLYREDEPTLTVATAGPPWSFDGDGENLRLIWFS